MPASVKAELDKQVGPRYLARPTKALGSAHIFHTKAAKLEGITPHVLRHSAASWMAAAGVPATTIAQRLGHASAAFSMARYAHPQQDDALALLAAWKVRQEG